MGSSTAGSQTGTDTGQSRMQYYLRRGAFALAGLVLLVITYFILAAIIPRWWAQRVGDWVDKSFMRGSWYGLVTGFVCTLVPLLLLFAAILVVRKRFGKQLATAAAVVAVGVAIPNLMTLSIVLGGGNASHAGQRILDVDGPGFRGGSLIGVIGAVAVFGAIAFFVFRYIRRGKQLRAVKEADRQLPQGPDVQGR